MFRRVVTLVIAFGLLVTIGSVGWYVTAFAEPEKMSPGGLYARLLVPAAVRDAARRAACQPVTISKSFNECGGYCGESYLLTAGNDQTAGADGLGFEHLAELAGKPAYWDEAIDLSPDTDQGQDCPTGLFKLTYWYEDKSQ